MSKNYQESRIEFRRSTLDGGEYPEARGIVVYQYGGTIEECIKNARLEFDLDEGWEVVKAEGENE